MIGEAPEAVEAALMQFYPGQGNPVLQALRGQISPRQLRVMIEHLPQNNPIGRELDGPWNDLHVLIHDVSTQLRLLRTEVHNAIYEKKITDPELLPNPNDPGDATPAGQGPPDTRSPERIKYEQDHLLAVLARPNPH